MIAGVRYWLKYNRMGSGILVTGSDQATEKITDESISVLSWQEVGDL
jgi:hypothetical protein